MLQECDKGLRVSPGDRATRRWEGRGKKLGCMEAAWQGETEGSVNKGPSQMAGNHYFTRQEYFASEEKCFPHDKLCISEHH